MKYLKYGMLNISNKFRNPAIKTVGNQHKNDNYMKYVLVGVGFRFEFIVLFKFAFYDLWNPCC